MTYGSPYYELKTMHPKQFWMNENDVINIQKNYSISNVFHYISNNNMSTNFDTAQLQNKEIIRVKSPHAFKSKFTPKVSISYFIITHLHQFYLQAKIYLVILWLYISLANLK